MKLIVCDPVKRGIVLRTRYENMLLVIRKFLAGARGYSASVVLLSSGSRMVALPGVEVNVASSLAISCPNIQDDLTVSPRCCFGGCTCVRGRLQAE